jgi:hypothetical protein
MFDDAKSPAQQGSETEADQREQRLRKTASRFARLAIATTGALHKDYHRSDKSLGALANERSRLPSLRATQTTKLAASARSGGMLELTGGRLLTRS